MSNVVEFRPRKREEDAYLLKVVGSVSHSLPYMHEDIFLRLALAMYDEDRASFDKAAEDLFLSRDSLVSRASGCHGTYKKEVEEAGNEYPHWLRPPKGYEWVPIEKD
ncbi:MAG: hypothetical protein M1579_04290 [Gammaproteobacteria bacterium]|nr:hypothetical protein [Gammaproteobacteria bacterium]